MHIASLSYHYGSVVGTSRHTRIWFQELGARRMDGPSGITRLFEDLFEDLWLPEMVSFVKEHLERAWWQDQRREGVDSNASGGDASMRRQAHRDLLDR